jgi:hypothetical protein
MPEQKELNSVISQLEKLSNRNYSPKVKIGIIALLVVFSSFAGSVITSTFIKPQHQNIESIPNQANNLPETSEYETSAQGVEYRVLRR